MTDAFDYSDVVQDQTEFRVAFGRGKTPELSFIKIVQSLRDYLNAAVSQTFEEMSTIETESGSADAYDPSSIYEGKGHLIVPIDSDYAAKARYLHEPDDVPILNDPIKRLPGISLYMARLVDSNNNKLTAVKSASDFRRRVREPKLMGWMGEGLGIESNPRFELYDDFDFLIDSSGVYVYKTKAFESVCNLAEVVRDSVAQNVEHLSEALPFVDFSPLLDEPSVRSARVLASLRGEKKYQRIEQGPLCDHCNRLGIQFEMVEGRIRIDAASRDTFLRLLNRQVLGIELVLGEPETYFTASRQPYSSSK